MRGAVFALIVAVLTACVSGMDPYILPAAEQLFTITSQQPIATCGGRYSHAAGQTTVIATVTCKDGQQGSVEIATKVDGHPVSGTPHLSDGSAATVIFTPILADGHVYGTTAFVNAVPAKPPTASVALATPEAPTRSKNGVAAAPAAPRALSAQSPPTGTGQLFRCTIPIPTIKEQMIKESVDRYPGSCPCPYFSDRAGRSCGKRSAWSRPGGHSPLCYPNDISADMVREFCQVLEMRRTR